MDAIGWVCEFVVHWWGVFGKNSGQIQIAIALGAIYFAMKAYMKAKAQVKIALDQNKLSLALDFLNTINNNLNKLGELDDLLLEYEDVLLRYASSDKNNDPHNTLKEIEYVKNRKNDLIKKRGLLLEISNNIESDDNLIEIEDTLLGLVGSCNKLCEIKIDMKRKINNINKRLKA